MGTRALLTLAVCLTLACQLPFDRPSAPDPYVERARIELDGRPFTFFHVASFGLLRDQQYLQRHRNGVRGDALPGQLAEVLRTAATAPRVVAIGGACSEKTLVVIEAALEQLGPGRLPGLELLFLGDARHGQALAPLFGARGARYRAVEITAH